MKLTGSGVVAAAGLVAVGLAAWYVFKKGGVFDKAKDIAATTLNPASDQNAAYQGANAVVQAVTGDSQATVGTKVYDMVDTVKGWFGMSQDQAVADMLKGTPASNYDTAGTVGANGTAANDAYTQWLEQFGGAGAL